MSETEESRKLALWLEGELKAQEVTPELQETIFLFRPDLAPEPRIDLDEILSSLREGPFSASKDLFNKNKQEEDLEEEGEAERLELNFAQAELQVSFDEIFSSLTRGPLVEKETQNSVVPLLSKGTQSSLEHHIEEGISESFSKKEASGTQWYLWSGIVAAACALLILLPTNYQAPSVDVESELSLPVAPSVQRDSMNTLERKKQLVSEIEGEILEIPLSTEDVARSSNINNEPLSKKSVSVASKTVTKKKPPVQLEKKEVVAESVASVPTPKNSDFASTEIDFSAIDVSADVRGASLSSQFDAVEGVGGIGEASGRSRAASAQVSNSALQASLSETKEEEASVSLKSKERGLKREAVKQPKKSRKSRARKDLELELVAEEESEIFSGFTLLMKGVGVEGSEYLLACGGQEQRAFLREYVLRFEQLPSLNQSCTLSSPMGAEAGFVYRGAAISCRETTDLFRCEQSSTD